MTSNLTSSNLIGNSISCLTSTSEANLSGAVTRAFEKQMTELYPKTPDLQDNLLIRVLSRVAKKLGLIRKIVAIDNANTYIVLLMGIGNQHRLFPICYANQIIPYCFDCWPGSWESWQLFFKKNQISTAFFSSRQVADYFSQTNSQLKCIWIPEATDPREYVHMIPLMNRSIDVIEMGRKYDSYHSTIEQSLSRNNKNHLYEKKTGQIIFNTRKKLIVALSQSKISICFPASITHPSKAEGIETVTHRYFESIASKCLIIGYCPDELRDLFGYNPIIDAQLDAGSNQILDILARIGEYQELVDKNYHRLLEIGTWETRVNTIRQELSI
jgi:hypothetical protein